MGVRFMKVEFKNKAITKEIGDLSFGSLFRWEGLIGIVVNNNYRELLSKDLVSVVWVDGFKLETLDFEDEVEVFENVKIVIQ